MIFLRNYVINKKYYQLISPIRILFCSRAKRAQHVKATADVSKFKHDIEREAVHILGRWCSKDGLNYDYWVGGDLTYRSTQCSMFINLGLSLLSKM